MVKLDKLLSIAVMRGLETDVITLKDGLISTTEAEELNFALNLFNIFLLFWVVGLPLNIALKELTIMVIMNRQMLNGLRKKSKCGIAVAIGLLLLLEKVKPSRNGQSILVLR
jgi:hypothetical protein